MARLHLLERRFMAHLSQRERQILLRLLGGLREGVDAAGAQMALEPPPPGQR
ncbi:MAG TPA: hypothetical protein VF155_05775 [Candidatus Dormibacteraeota bacterium]